MGSSNRALTDLLGRYDLEQSRRVDVIFGESLGHTDFVQPWPPDTDSDGLGTARHMRMGSPL